MVARSVSLSPKRSPYCPGVSQFREIGRRGIALLFEEPFEIVALQIGLGEDEFDAIDSGSGIQHAAGPERFDGAGTLWHGNGDSGFNWAPDAIFRCFTNTANTR